jgi:integrase
MRCLPGARPTFPRAYQGLVINFCLCPISGVCRSGSNAAKRMNRVDVFRMIRKRALQAGLNAEASCHTFSATGITAYLKSGGTLENAQAIAAHESPRTTKIYDRTQDAISSTRWRRFRSEAPIKWNSVSTFLRAHHITKLSL